MSLRMVIPNERLREPVQYLYQLANTYSKFLCPEDFRIRAKYVDKFGRYCYIKAMWYGLSYQIYNVRINRYGPRSKWKSKKV